MTLKTLVAATIAIGLLLPACTVVQPHYHHRGLHGPVAAHPGYKKQHPHGMPPGQAKKDCSHGHSKWCD